MALDKDGNEVSEINWLRNPYGLCNWAEDNIDDPDTESLGTLYYVCNYWAYDGEAYIDRQLFRAVVLKYFYAIRRLKEGYFFFNLPEYRQFIEGKLEFMKTEDSPLGLPRRIVGSRYDHRGRLAIPMQQFADPVFDLGGLHTLDHYKTWSKELVDFAELLQDPNNEFYCSN